MVSLAPPRGLAWHIVLLAALASLSCEAEEESREVFAPRQTACDTDQSCGEGQLCVLGGDELTWCTRACSGADGVRCERGSAYCAQHDRGALCAPLIANLPPACVGGGNSGNTDAGIAGGGGECPVEGRSCDEYCRYLGLEPDGCDGGECSCGEPTNAACVDGMSAFCTCADAVEMPCSSDLVAQLYFTCHTAPETAGGAYVLCFQRQISGDQIDCPSAAETCR